MRIIRSEHNWRKGKQHKIRNDDPNAATKVAEFAKQNSMNYAQAVELQQYMLSMHGDPGERARAIIPYWGGMVPMKSDKNAIVFQAMCRSVMCPTKIKLADGMEIPMHNPAKPCFSSRGCIGVDSDPVNPKRVYLTPDWFYMDEWHYRRWRDGKMDIGNELIMNCHHCIGDHIANLVERDPTLFVDLFKAEIDKKHGIS